jgi:hypothetical protein
VRPEGGFRVPISDNYVVQYLLQATEASSDFILWTEKASDGYTANFRGIRLEVECVPSRAGQRLYLSIFSVSEKIQIQEPFNYGIFREKYKSEDEQRLAGLMKDLIAAIAKQCAARRNRTAEMTAVIRQSIYGRLIGADGQ